MRRAATKSTVETIATEAGAKLSSKAGRATGLVNWPETTADFKPVAKSKENIAAFLDSEGITLFKDTFRETYHLRGLPGFDELTDEAVRRLWFMAQGLGLKPSRDYFLDALLDIASENGRNPLLDWLNGLKWDGTPRLDNLHADYIVAEAPLGVRHVEFNKEVGAKTLIAAVRRARHPGSKFDTVPVYEGPQGTLKSTAVRTLAGDNFFEDHIPFGADPKLVIEQMRGKWMGEVSELSTMPNRAIENVKAMVSRTADTARPAYGRMSVTVPRKWVLIGTTNNRSYLKDKTGNRRFWPIAIKKVDLEKLKRDREQLWAEAAVREAEGEDIVLSERLWSIAAKLQEEREVSDPVFERLAETLEGLFGTLTTDEVYRVFERPTDNGSTKPEVVSRYTPGHGAKVREAMEKLGWRYARLSGAEGSTVRPRAYVKTSQDGAAPRLFFNPFLDRFQSEDERDAKRNGKVIDLKTRNATGERMAGECT